MRLGMCMWLAVVVACGDEPLCEDNDGNELPICVYEEVDGPGLEYCPGDHWGATDGCNSCGCDPDGNVVCTTEVCSR